MTKVSCNLTNKHDTAGSCYLLSIMHEECCDKLQCIPTPCLQYQHLYNNYTCLKLQFRYSSHIWHRARKIIQIMRYHTSTRSGCKTWEIERASSGGRSVAAPIYHFSGHINHHHSELEITMTPPGSLSMIIITFSTSTIFSYNNLPLHIAVTLNFKDTWQRTSLIVPLLLFSSSS